MAHYEPHDGDLPPYTLHPAPYTLHPTPYTLHPSPFTLKSAPYTLHPTPYTLHPTPYTLALWRGRALGGPASASLYTGVPHLQEDVPPLPLFIQGYLTYKKMHPPRTLP